MHEKNKLPAYQWYPGDWLKDPNVRLLTLEEKGAWRELLDYMWEADERGKMASNGEPWPMSRIARLLGVDETKANQIITTLVELNVASKDEATGIIFSRRQVRFKDLQEIRRENGRKGGRPPKHESENLDESKTKAKKSPSSSTSVEEGAAAALSATSEATPRSPENRRENPEPEPEPERKTIWPEQRHLDIDFWVEKLTETEGAEQHVHDAAINAGLDSEDAYLMEVKLILLKRDNPLNRRLLAKGMVDHCKFKMDSPRYREQMKDAVA